MNTNVPLYHIYKSPLIAGDIGELTHPVSLHFDQVTRTIHLTLRGHEGEAVSVYRVMRITLIAGTHLYAVYATDNIGNHHLYIVTEAEIIGAHLPRMFLN